MSKQSKSKVALPIVDPQSVPLTANDMREIERILAIIRSARAPASNWARETIPSSNPLVVPVSQRAFDLACAMRFARRVRKSLFASSIFGEPAWDMLLALFVTEQEGRRLTITQLAQMSEAPMTTAIRWLDYLAQSRLILRRAHPTDARIVYVELSELGREKLNAYFAAFLEAGDTT